MRLPRARGSLSRQVLDTLLQPVHPAPGLADAARSRLTECATALDDEDVQLALTVLQELGYDGLDDVDDGWERSPDVLAARGVLEAAIESELVEAVSLMVRRALPQAADDVAAALFAMTEATSGRSMAAYVQRHATVEQLREFLVLRSVFQLKEADPHTWLVPRLHGGPKAALIEILTDEYGGGRLERMHSELFATSMAHAGLDPTYGAYVDRVPAASLAISTTATMLGQQRRLRGAAAGHLTAIEATSSLPNRQLAQGVRRLGLADAAAWYFDEHVEADAVHEQVATRDLCAGLVAQQPELLESVLFGAAVSLWVDDRAGAAALDAWESGGSALLPDAGADLDEVG